MRIIRIVIASFLLSTYLIGHSQDDDSPTAPANLTSHDITTNSVRLTWDASYDSAGVTGYTIYNGSNILTSSVTSLEYTITGLDPSSVYVFTVVAYDLAGNISGASNVVNVTTLDNIPPTAPSGLASHDITGTSVRLTWNTSTDNVLVTGYVIYNGTDSITTVASTQHILTGLTSSNDYTFYIKATDAAGNKSTASNTVNIRTLDPPDIINPSIPGNLTPHDITMKSIRFTWVTSTDNIGVIGYVVYRGTDSIAQVNALEYTVNTLTPATRYLFSVKAKDAAGNKSLSSNVVDTVTAKDIAAPSIPAGLIASDTTTTSVRLTWNPSTDNVGVTGYIIYRGSDSVTTVTTTQHILTSLTPATTYTFSLRATDAAGNKSTASNTVSVRTLAPPDITNPTAPGSLTPHNVTMTSIRLSWSISTDNIGVIGYVVYRGTDSIANVNALEYTVSALTPATRYLFSVRAKDAAGNKSLPSNIVDTVTAKDILAPSIPAGLAAYDTTTTSVRLTWNPSTDNIGVAGYVIYNGVDSITTVAATQHILTGLTPATNYTFSIKAKDAAGNKSASSLVISVKTRATADIISPTAPSNLFANNITVTSVKLGWSTSTDNVGVTGYVIYRGADSVTTVSALECTIIGLLPSTSYTFSIRARDAAGNKSTASLIAIITAVDHAAPSAPANLIGNDITISSVRLTWNASIDNVGVTGYVVYRGTDSLTTVTSLEYTVGGLTLGSNYSFSVRAKDASGNKSAATTISITTSNDVTPPSAPTNLTGNNITASSIRLTWAAATDNVGVTGYIIFRGSDMLITVTGTEYTVTGLTPATDYSFTVRARDAGGNSSAASNIVSIRTLAPSDIENPSAPTNLIVTNITTITVNLIWKASTDNVGVVCYVVYIGSDSLSTVTGLGYTVTGLTPSTRYSFSVKAKDAAGNKSLSSNIASTKTHILPDTECPTTPIDLAAYDTSSTNVRLTWVGSTDNSKVTGYRIYVNNELYASSSATEFIVTDLLPDSTYTMYIIAYDAAANLSDTSNEVCITTLHGIDVIPPSIPQGLTVYNLTSEQISFRWDPATDNDELYGYQIYVNEELLTTTTLTEFSLIDLLPNTIYTFYVRAIDVSGNVSGPSLKISASTNGIVGIRGTSTFSLLTFIIGDNRMDILVPSEVQYIEKAEIYNLSGRLVYNSNAILEYQIINIDQADFSKGIYILVLKGNTFMVSTKFIY